MISIDLNMDLGEGIGNERQLMPFISSCNVACGGHYGDEKSIKQTLLLAQKNQVKAGAHPSFEDRENFGRVWLDWDESRFRESVINQISLFKQVAREVGSPLHHIKMHGALYHATSHEPLFVRWTIQLLIENYPETPIYVPAGTLLEQELQKAKLPYITEAFADRRYLENGLLVPRSSPNAVITDVSKLVNQLAMMVHTQKVLTVEETELGIAAQTYCIHGDNEAIVSKFDQIRAALKLNHIEIA